MGRIWVPSAATSLGAPEADTGGGHSGERPWFGRTGTRSPSLEPGNSCREVAAPALGPTECDRWYASCAPPSSAHPSGAPPAGAFSTGTPAAGLAEGTRGIPVAGPTPPSPLPPLCAAPAPTPPPPPPFAASPSATLTGAGSSNSGPSACTGSSSAPRPSISGAPSSSSKSGKYSSAEEEW